MVRGKIRKKNDAQGLKKEKTLNSRCYKVHNVAAQAECTGTWSVLGTTFVQRKNPESHLQSGQQGTGLFRERE